MTDNNNSYGKFNNKRIKLDPTVFEDVLRVSIAKQFQRLAELVDEALPERPMCEEELSRDQLAIVNAVNAIQEEWVLDPATRSDVSILRWEDHFDGDVEPLPDFLYEDAMDEAVSLDELLDTYINEKGLYQGDTDDEEGNN